ncbi:SIMPL domain-containing protein [Maribacter algicola]|uniref:SIMPL domain-containing protein n=1 Tax=Maribacter algicola TaxID=2498892 RepID=A0A3R8R0Y9_9FLAO|nr:SIMPL domain-containing protein [Maribacter algicola]RRQ47860.1 SIMPL domain-containing protein [Maribacter algicola]
MKKSLLLLFFLCFLNTLFAQESPNTINTNGTYEYDFAPTYTSSMIVSLNNVYYDAQTVSLEELKKTYKDKLGQAGLDTSKLKEDPLSYALMGYEKDGIILTYTTDSLEEMQNFLLVKSMGVSRSETSMKARLTDSQMADYAHKAYENAKQKAEAIAKKIGRSVGKVIYISDGNNEEINESLYYGNAIKKRTYYLNASFELL